MAQRHQHSYVGIDGSAWLETLIDAFERTEDLGDVPCDAKIVSSVMSRLQRPALTTVPSHQRRRRAVLEAHH